MSYNEDGVFDESEREEVDRVRVNVIHIREDLNEFASYYWPLYEAAGFTSRELAYIAYRCTAVPERDDVC